MGETSQDDNEAYHNWLYFYAGQWTMSYKCQMCGALKYCFATKRHLWARYSDVEFRFCKNCLFPLATVTHQNYRGRDILS